MQKILIIQTAFIGDVILATPVIERVKEMYPEAKIDFLLRKGNESLLTGHPHLNNVLIWNKKEGKYKALFKVIKEIRKEKYDLLINLQRFASSGLITLFSSAKLKAGFNKNPMSFCYNHTAKHLIKDGTHEVERNLLAIPENDQTEKRRPVLYPSEQDFHLVEKYKESPYICAAPASVWPTKRLPVEKWKELFQIYTKDFTIYLLGGKDDKAFYDALSDPEWKGKVVNLAGELSFLKSAALMKDAAMNFVNDSAPLHIVSSMNAPVKAFFCSTVPDFGFGPLSDNSEIIETELPLDCRPCNLHGKTECPEKHFNCGHEIEIQNNWI